MERAGSVPLCSRDTYRLILAKQLECTWRATESDRIYADTTDVRLLWLWDSLDSKISMVSCSACEHVPYHDGKKILDRQSSPRCKRPYHKTSTSLLRLLSLFLRP